MSSCQNLSVTACTVTTAKNDNVFRTIKGNVRSERLNPKLKNLMNFKAQCLHGKKLLIAAAESNFEATMGQKVHLLEVERRARHGGVFNAMCMQLYVQSTNKRFQVERRARHGGGGANDDDDEDEDEDEDEDDDEENEVVFEAGAPNNAGRISANSDSDSDSDDSSSDSSSDDDN